MSNVIHRRSHEPIHNIWLSMIARCSVPTNHKWPVYGGRGIKVCERWLTFTSFLADMGERPSPRHSIDRIDPDGGYEPGNCRWATQTEQQRNRRNNRVVEFNGERLCVSEWAERLGIKPHTLGYRLRAGWPLDRALSACVRRCR